MRNLLAIVVLALGIPCTAAAMTVEGDWSLNGDALSGDSGLQIRLSRQAGSFSFDQGGGETSLKLFRIWTDEADVGRDDTIARSLIAGFSLPDTDRVGTIAGASRGHDQFGFQWGTLKWDTPLEMSYDGGMLSILLSDVTYGRGLFGLGKGKSNGANVFAKVSYAPRGAVAPVPLPAGLPLALTGLGLLALAGRRPRREPARATW